MRKLAVLLAGLSIVGTSIFAGELTSYTNEVKSNYFSESKTNMIEWTVAKGAYKLNDKFNFTFDVDRDFKILDGADNKGGWDTQFGLVQSMDKLGNWDYSLNYLVRHDASWNDVKDSGYSYYNQYIISPYFEKSIELAGKEYALGVELWAQVGGKLTETQQTKNGYETNFYLSGSPMENLDVSLAVYNMDYYSSSKDRYEYTLGTEDEVKYTIPLAAGFDFVAQAYLYAERNFETESYSIDANLTPMVKYKKSINDNLSVHASFEYEIVNFERATGSSKTTTDDNEMEITAGFKYRP